jgi:hypothetical protein
VEAHLGVRRRGRLALLVFEILAVHVLEVLHFGEVFLRLLVVVFAQAVDLLLQFGLAARSHDLGLVEWHPDILVELCLHFAVHLVQTLALQRVL